MKLKLRIACAALLLTTALPALALQLGEIQVKSALNQPLVAAIPLHPKNLTELQGLTVGLASSEDFQRAGLPLTPTDQTLRFHVVTDNNGQKLILVTSSQPITDPYLDFLVQVNTREGKQVREFVVLLNPVIAAPAPAVQAAPVASAPSQVPAAAPPPQQLPAPSQFPQPRITPTPPAKPQPQHHPVAAPAPTGNLQTGGQINVQRGDTLYSIARQATQGTNVSINQMMLAMQATNPHAFFKNNINNLKAGAILRIPTRSQINRRSAAVAAAEVHRQIEAWRAAKPHPATVVEGSAAQAAANAAPKPEQVAPASDHLTLVPPTGEAGGSNNRPGVAGGTGTATIAGLKQQLQADKDTLISLNQSNSDLESRVHSLEDISAKTSKLLSLKDATIAELQHKLAGVHLGMTASAGKVLAATAKSSASAKPAVKRVTPHAVPQPWYMRPIAWIIAALIVLGLIVLGVFIRRRGAAADSPAHGPLADPEDVSPLVPENDHAPVDEPQAVPDETVEPEVAATADEPVDDPYGLAALRRPVDSDQTVLAPLAPATPSTPSAPAAPVVVEAPQMAEPPVAIEPLYSNDPVDTKLDLARAYLDMGDPVGARAMLEEVIEEGTQMQKDEAKRLLAEAAG